MKRLNRSTLYLKVDFNPWNKTNIGQFQGPIPIAKSIQLQLTE